MTTGPLKISDIIRFLNAKGANYRCVSCSSTKFDYLDEQSEKVVVALLGFRFPPHNINETDMYDVVVLACANCGECRLYMRRPILDWLARNPAN